MGDQLFMNASVLSCNSAVKCSILYISWILSLHWVIVGGCGFSQHDVITLFAIRRRALRSFVWLFSSRLSGNIPKMKCDGSNGMSINKHVFISLCFQYSNNFGQSQNICVWSPTLPQPLQHCAEVLLHLDVISGVLKYLILIFHPNSLQLGLLVTLCPCSHEFSRCSSEIIVFISSSHFSLISKLFSFSSSCNILYRCDMNLAFTVVSIVDIKNFSILDGGEQSFSHSWCVCK